MSYFTVKFISLTSKNSANLIYWDCVVRLEEFSWQTCPRNYHQCQINFDWCKEPHPLQTREKSSEKTQRRKNTQFSCKINTGCAKSGKTFSFIRDLITYCIVIKKLGFSGPQR